MIFNEVILHDFSVPLAERAKSRKFCGPYHWRPSAPGAGRAFYAEGRGGSLHCAKHGSGFRLRLEYANDHLSGRVARVTGYYADEDCDQTVVPIIARLPHSRGFLAGWTYGAGMISAVDPEIYVDAESAAYAAHSIAERQAERDREASAESEDEDTDTE